MSYNTNYTKIPHIQRHIIRYKNKDVTLMSFCAEIFDTILLEYQMVKCQPAGVSNGEMLPSGALIYYFVLVNCFFLKPVDIGHLKAGSKGQERAWKGQHRPKCLRRHRHHHQ